MMPRAPLGFVVNASDLGVTVTVHGDIDLREAHQLVGAVAACVAGPTSPKVLTLDVGGVRFCDSAGLAALMQMRRSCQNAGWVFALHAVELSLRRLLDQTGLTAWFELET